MLAGCWYPFFSGAASLRQQVAFEMRLEDMSASAHKGMGDCAHNNMLSLSVQEESIVSGRGSKWQFT